MRVFIPEALRVVKSMTAKEAGAFLILSMRLWDKGSLQLDDDGWLGIYAGLRGDEWLAVKRKVLEAFSKDKRGYSDFDKMLGRDRQRSIPRSLRRAVYERDGRRCRYCGSTAGPFQIDHIFPWSRGGRHQLENLTVACQACNAAKSNMSAEEFSESRS